MGYEETSIQVIEAETLVPLLELSKNIATWLQKHSLVQRLRAASSEAQDAVLEAAAQMQVGNRSSSKS